MIDDGTGLEDRTHKAHVHPEEIPPIEARLPPAYKRPEPAPEHLFEVFEVLIGARLLSKHESKELHRFDRVGLVTIGVEAGDGNASIARQDTKELCCVFPQLTFIPVSSVLTISLFMKSSVMQAGTTSTFLLVVKCLTVLDLSTTSTEVVSSTYLTSRSKSWSAGATSSSGS